MNPVRKLRDTLGWSQTHLAQAVGRSYQTIRNWEAGHRVPLESLEKMKSIAAEHGLADIAVELSSQEWQVRRVFHPAETIISQAKPAVPRKTVDFPVEQAKHRAAVDEREKAHQLLDEICDSGDAGAISAVFQNLNAFARLARLMQKSAAASRKKR